MMLTDAHYICIEGASWGPAVGHMLTLIRLERQGEEDNLPGFARREGYTQLHTV